MYRFVDHSRLAAELCHALNKPGLYLAFPEDFEPSELEKAAPYLTEAFAREQQDSDNPLQSLVEEKALIICDTEEERDGLYNRTVGDDGPTKSNPYNGPCRVYALTISPEGEFLNENT